MTNPILLGDRIDRFRIIEQIGKGGMGEVYVGHDEILDRKVALKSIRSEHRLNAEARARFLREARVLSQLRHPHICQIYDYIEGTEADFLVLELIHGRSLSRAMRDGLSYKQKLNIAGQIASVLVAAHEKGIVHRDLKPDNVMLMDGNVVKVLDFGLSRSQLDETTEGFPSPAANAEPVMPSVTSGDATQFLTPENAQTEVIESTDVSSSGRVTTLGAIMGTLGHMSPEQARGEVATTASDLYSFGLLLQELFTGHAAFAEEADRSRQLKKAQEGETRAIEGLDADLTTLIRRLESLAPAARPSAADVSERLAWIANTPRRRRRRALLAAAMVALVLFALAMTVLSIRATRAEAAAKKEAERANREAEASKKVSDFLLGIFKISDPSEARGNSVTARELLDKGAVRIDKELQAQPEIRARLMDTMGSVYMNLGLYPQAEPLLRSGLAIRRATLGADHPDVAQSLQNLAILCWSEGKYAEAEPLLRSAIDIREKALGPQSPDLAKSLNGLAVVYKSQGKLAQAEPLYLRSFKIMEKTLGPNHPDVGTSLNNLASLYFAQEKYAQAEPLLRRSLSIKERTLGADHPDVASSLNNLAELMTNEKKYADAEPLYRRSLAIRERVFGANHRDVAESLDNLGTLFVMEGKLADAEPLILQALAIRRNVLGAAHPYTAFSLSELAQLRRKQQRFDEAEKLYADAAAILEKAGDESFQEVLEHHAEMLRQLGRNAEAARLEARADAFKKANE